MSKFEDKGYTTTPFIIKVNKERIRIHPSEIIGIISSNNHSEVYLTGNRKLLVRCTLKKMEAQLSRYHFVRIHRRAIINIMRVKSIINYFVIMEDNFTFKIARGKKRIILNLFPPPPSAL